MYAIGLDWQGESRFVTQRTITMAATEILFVFRVESRRAHRGRRDAAPAHRRVPAVESSPHRYLPAARAQRRPVCAGWRYEGF